LFSSTSRRQRCSFDADRFAEALTDDLQCDADHGIIARGSRGLLTLLEGRSRFA